MGAPTDGRDGASPSKGRLRLASDGEGIPAGGARPHEDDARGFAASIGAGDAPAPGLDNPGFSTDEDTYLVGEEHPDVGGEGEEAPKSAEGPTAEEEIAAARLALADLVLSDSRAWALYERQCEEGLVGMHRRARELRLLLEAGAPDAPARAHEQGAVEVAIPELALRTHPESVAAAWERLHSRARVCREYAVNERDGAVAAAVDLAGKDEVVFRTLSLVALDGDGPREPDLLEAARVVHKALLSRGLRFRPRRFADHVWAACREVFPGAPGVRWDDDWADALLRRALRRIGGVAPSGDADGDAARVEAEVGEALASRDRRRYRRAVGALVALGLRAAPGHPAGTPTGGTGRGERAHKDAPPARGERVPFADLVALAREVRRRHERGPDGGSPTAAPGA